MFVFTRAVRNLSRSEIVRTNGLSLETTTIARWPLVMWRRWMVSRLRPRPLAVVIRESRFKRGEVGLSGHDAAGLPDSQTLTFIPSGTALWFALASLLPSPKDKSKQERGRYDNQRQNGAHRRAAVRRSMIGQGW